MNLHACIPSLWAEDRTTRSEAIRAIVLADKAAYDDAIVAALVQALDHNDYEIQEYATVALRRLRGDRRVIDALWRCFRTETRHSARSCALIALGRLGKCLPPAELQTLYAERKDHPKDLILESAIRWAGQNDSSPEMLLALRVIQRAEAERVRQEPRLRITIATAMVRAARHGLVRKSLTKPWLKEHGFQDVLDKLRETRIDRLIEEARARRDQPLLKMGLAEVVPEHVPLVPGRPLDDVALEQYLQDRAEMLNERIVEQHTYVQDRHLAAEMKRKAGYRCQSCQEALNDPLNASRFVQAHHVEPSSEGGSDIAENLIVLCPNCHAKMHAGALQIEREAEGWRVVGSKPPDGPRATSSARTTIIELFLVLDPNEREGVLLELAGITNADANEGVG